ncbi:PREDICTED: TBC1 domain family member 10A-like [Priapulus caudatus]|uniref:TBC1 domain family member 10A-like n=1 Tax=Priapulus caudatus TaxID=37621 RepID=A0ABM1EHD0_PRICU|nr:PREDICTED: TBC1 domain family member 10A-like [Priapulus caudatus]
MTEWFMCIYSRTLPWASVLRVWDMFFCEGVKVMFKVALVLLKSMLGRPEQLKQCPDMDETLDRLRNVDQEYMQEDYLAFEATRIKITERDMEKEHQLQVAKRRLQKEREQGTFANLPPATVSAPSTLTHSGGTYHPPGGANAAPLSPFHTPTNGSPSGALPPQQPPRSQTPDGVSTMSRLASKPPRGAATSRPKSTEEAAAAAGKMRRSSGRRAAGSGSPPATIVPFVAMPASLAGRHDYAADAEYPDFLPRAMSPPGGASAQLKVGGERRSGRVTPQRRPVTPETPSRDSTSPVEPNGGLTPTSGERPGYTRHVYTS